MWKGRRTGGACGRGGGLKGRVEGGAGLEGN